MNPQQWERLKDAFSIVIAGGRDSASEAIAEAARGDDQMAHALRMLVEEHFRLVDVAPRERSEAQTTAVVPELPGVLADRFRVLARLGAGTFGDVFRATDQKAGAEVAVKVLRSRDARALEYFKREFRTLADVRHPNLLKLHDLVAAGDQWMFSMELVDGVDFLRFLSREPADSRPSALRALLTQLASGVRALHERRLLHRDLKPTNVLVTPGGRLVILDFGLVRLLGDESPVTFAGTPDYMSPEQAAGVPSGEPSDWYAVGVMLYQALTGLLPFRGEFLDVLRRKQLEVPAAPSSLVAGVSPGLDRLCMKLLERNPATRGSYSDIVTAVGTDVPSAQDRVADVALVGRSPHLRSLLDAYGAASTRPVVAHVCGPSGIGKTKLLREFLRHVGDIPTVVLAGRCYERQSIPYQGLDDVIDQVAHFLRRLPPGEMRELLPRNLAVLAHMFPVLGQFVRREKSATVGTESAELKMRGVAALREMLGRIAERYRVVIVIDDLQWGDHDSGAALNELLSASDSPPMLVVLAYRSEDVSSSACISAVHAGGEGAASRSDVLIDLATLSDPECRRLAAAVSSRALDHAALQQIVMQSAGNPFLIHEIVRWFNAEGADVPLDRFSLERVVRSRVDTLDQHSRRLVELVALAGEPTALEVFRGVPEVGNLIAARDELLAARFIRSRLVQGREELEIYHDRIRAALASMIDPERRVVRHRELAYALEATGGDPERIATHLYQAMEPELCSRYVLEAANRAVRVMAFNKAAQLLRLALSTGGLQTDTRRVVHRQLGDALANAGRGAEAAEHYLAAASGAAARDQLHLKQRAAEELLFSGHVDEGLEIFRQLLAQVGMTLPANVGRVSLSLLLQRARLRLHGLRWVERDAEVLPTDTLLKLDVCSAVSTGLALIDIARGAALQTASLLLAMKAGEPARLARALAMEAGYRSTSGVAGVRRAEQILDRARDLAQRGGDPRALGLVAVMGATCAWSAGRWEECVNRARTAKEILQGAYERVTWERDTAAIFEVDGLRWSGRWAEMKALLPELLLDARSRGDLYAEAILQMHAGSCAALADDDAERARAGLALLRRWSNRGFHVEHLVETHNQVEIALYESRARHAFDLIARRWPALRKSLLLRVQTLRIQMRSVRSRAAIAAARESASERRSLIAMARRDALAIRGEKTGWGEALADLLEASIEAVDHGPLAAISPLVRAERNATQAGMLLHAQVARRARSLLTPDTPTEVQLAELALRSEGIARPDRFSEMMLPGVSRT
jgi:hypothetical protein